MMFPRWPKVRGRESEKGIFERSTRRYNVARPEHRAIALREMTIKAILDTNVVISGIFGQASIAEVQVDTELRIDLATKLQ